MRARVFIPTPAILVVWKSLPRVLVDLLLEVPIQLQLRDHRPTAEAVVAVGGIEEAPVAPLVLVEIDHGPGALLAETRQTRQRLEVLLRNEIPQLLVAYRLGGLGRGPPVHAAHHFQDAPYALRADAAPEVVDLAHPRKRVVLLPVPDELPHALDGRGVFRDELDRHRVAHVAAVGAGQVLGEGLYLHFYRRRVEGEVHRNTGHDLLH